MKLSSRTRVQKCDWLTTWLLVRNLRMLSFPENDGIRICMCNKLPQEMWTKLAGKWTSFAEQVSGPNKDGHWSETGQYFNFLYLLQVQGQRRPSAALCQGCVLQSECDQGAGR